MREFGRQWQEYSRVQAVRDWAQQHTTFSSITTNSNTSAIDTLLETAGVCRDFTHLMIALCRAIKVPARPSRAKQSLGAKPSQLVLVGMAERR
jgi:transglutaminase-like putative cysteine protease